MLFLIWADEKYNTQENPSVVFATQKNPGVFHRPKKIPFGRNVRPKKILRTPPSLKYVSGAPGIIPGGYLLDLRDTDKSWYFGIIEFNNNIVLSFGHWVSFLMNICHFAIFMQKWSQEGEKRCFIYSWADYYLQANTITWHVQTIFCRQLFAGRVVDSPPMKRKKNLHLNDNYVIYFQIKVSTKVQGFNLHNYQCFISYGSGVLCLLFSILHE